MKKFHYITACLAAAAVIAGCAKTAEEATNASTKMYLDAWTGANYPSATVSSKGLYILEDQVVGSGDQWDSDNGFAKVLFTETDMVGNIYDTTDEDLAKVAGLYSNNVTFGPRIWLISEGSYGVYAGLEDALNGMRVGGTRKVLVPSWLMTYKRYSSDKDYYSKQTSATNTIYTISLLDQCSNVYDWEVEDVEAFVEEHMHGVDSTYYGGDESGLKYGFYYDRVSVPEKWADYEMPSDTVVYINYTGRLLSGKVFDTTIAQTAKEHGIYSQSKDYSPVQINIKEDYNNITMTASESSLITGFKAALKMMHPYEHGNAAFISTLGYGYSGSGSSIRPFTPISFEITLVDKP